MKNTDQKDRRRRSPVRGFLICLLAGGIVMALVSRGRFLSSAYPGESGRLAACLSDGAFVAGVFMTGIGLLLWISTTGFFDIMRYGIHGLWNHLLPMLRQEKRESYYEFRQSRSKERAVIPCPLLFCGVLFLLASAVFYGLCQPV